MRVTPDTSDPRKYVQIAENLEAQITSGVLMPRKVITISRIADEFKVARQTARHALKVIERKGLVASYSPIGHVVTHNTELGEMMCARKEETARVSELSGKVAPGTGHALGSGRAA